MASVMAACFRRNDADDPAAYVRATVMILTEFSFEVVSRVCHPAKGLPAKQQFLPTPFEVRQACERECDYYERELSKQRQRAKEAAENAHRATVSDEARDKALAYGKAAVEKLRGTEAPKLSALQEALRSTPGDKDIDPTAAEMLKASVTGPISISPALASKLSQEGDAA